MFEKPKLSTYRPDMPSSYKRDGVTLTNSLSVAAFFEVNHECVLRAIAELECSDDFREHFFIKTFHPDEGNRVVSVLEMRADGLIYLTNKLPGPKAKQFWMEYVRHEFFREYACQLREGPELDAKVLGVEKLADLFDILFADALSYRLDINPPAKQLDHVSAAYVLYLEGVGFGFCFHLMDKVSEWLSEYCIENDVPIEHCQRTSVKLFHIDAVESWLRIRGAWFIAQEVFDWEWARRVVLGGSEDSVLIITSE